MVRTHTAANQSYTTLLLEILSQKSQTKPDHIRLSVMTHTCNPSRNSLGDRNKDHCLMGSPGDIGALDSIQTTQNWANHVEFFFFPKIIAVSRFLKIRYDRVGNCWERTGSKFSSWNPSRKPRASYPVCLGFAVLLHTKQ